MTSIKVDSSAKLMANGIITGCISTVIFNPVDRALFLMVKENKSILTPSLWKHPYLGVSNAIYSRVIGYGIFFSLADIYKEFFKNKSNHPAFYSSLATAMTTVTLTQPINVMKMYKWNHHIPGSFESSNKQLLSKYGWSVLFKGMPSTCLRDGTFTSTYFVLSEKFNREKDFTTNVAIASFATMLSSPVNYFRSRQFFSFDERNITLRKTAQELAEEVNKEAGLLSKVHHITHKRFNIGWGTLRVGVGMAVANKIYDWLKQVNF